MKKATAICADRRSSKRAAIQVAAILPARPPAYNHSTDAVTTSNRPKSDFWW